MKSINTSTFDFPTLIREGFVYVDKTRQIYETFAAKEVVAGGRNGLIVEAMI